MTTEQKADGGGLGPEPKFDGKDPSGHSERKRTASAHLRKLRLRGFDEEYLAADFEISIDPTSK